MTADTYSASRNIKKPHRLSGRFQRLDAASMSLEPDVELRLGKVRRPNEPGVVAFESLVLYRAVFASEHPRGTSGCRPLVAKGLVELMLMM